MVITEQDRSCVPVLLYILSKDNDNNTTRKIVFKVIIKKMSVDAHAWTLTLTT